MKLGGALRQGEWWKSGAYQLSVNTNIEDLAGNHIGQAFDIDVFDHASDKSISVSSSGSPRCGLRG